MQPVNNIILEKLAREVADHTIFVNWPIYAIIAFLSLLATIAGSYLGTRATKSAEVAAAKENLDEIKRQLKETTEASKSVEIALNHSDWVRREENSLRREKLEQMLTAAFAIATWSQEEAKLGLIGGDVETKAPIDEFEMLSQLYFPELSAECGDVERTYRESSLEVGPVRREVMQLKHLYDATVLTKEFNKLPEILEEMSSVSDRSRKAVLGKATSVYAAVQTLCKASRKIMRDLTSAPPSRD